MSFATVMEVYGKRNVLCQHVLSTYKNKTTQMGWFERYGEKFYFASGVCTKGGDQSKFVYKTSIGISGDETLQLCEGLGKATRLPSTFNDFCLSEGTDWQGNSTRLMLCDSDFGGLVMLRLKACKPDIEIVEADDSDPDPDPMEDDDAELPMDPDAGCAVWNECFEKFYFSKKDDWQKFRKTILAMYEDVQHL
jgi:hypothetical protein